MRIVLAGIVAGLLLPVIAGADNTEAEIEYLLGTIGESGCTFIRNGTRHSAEDAESHLRMKYKRGKRYASSAENFIERLANASSWTGKPYYMECGANDAVPTGEWLTAQLSDYRKNGYEKILAL